MAMIDAREVGSTSAEAAAMGRISDRMGEACIKEPISRKEESPSSTSSLGCAILEMRVGGAANCGRAPFLYVPKYEQKAIQSGFILNELRPQCAERFAK